MQRIEWLLNWNKNKNEYCMPWVYISPFVVVEIAAGKTIAIFFRLTYRPTDRPTDRLTDRKTNRLTYRLPDRPRDSPTDRQTLRS
jgi:hypothetical protein